MIRTAVLLCLVGVTAPAYAQQDQQGEKDEARHEDQAKTNKGQGKKQAKSLQQKGQPHQDHAQQQAKQADKNEHQQPQAQHQAQQQREREQAQQLPAQQQNEQLQAQRDQKQQLRAQQQLEQNLRQTARLSQQRQQQLIAEQQQRTAQYRQHLDQQQQRRDAVLRQTALLQQQNRESQYRHQTEYIERMHQQQLSLARDRDHDYARDPYFYTAPIYRYSRGGRYYETNQPGADFLRQAVNYGYAEGLRTGRADRQDRWRSSYRDSYAFQDANYGYTGYYVGQDEYNYYFREGFRRGYEDGYARRYQYGRYSDGSYSMLGSVLAQVLNFQSLR
jgi:hypothetical protein